MKWTLACATAFAVAAVTGALTLTQPGYTMMAEAAPVHVSPVTDSYIIDHPHPARVVVAPQRVWVVRSGDTLSGIARSRYHKEAAWTLVYWANHKQIRWANRIQVGQRFWLPDFNGTIPAAPKLLEPPPPPAPPRAVVVTSTVTSHPTYQAQTYQPGGTYHGSGSMQTCIISRESGGDSQVMNSTGHYGLYQFSYSTWIGSGGSGADFGHASVAEQNQVFYNAVAARGYSDWTPYDGC